jgi:hypothetical protein
MGMLVENLKNLKYLNLYGCIGITAKGFSYLKDLSMLAQLNISEFRIDTEVGEVLSQMQQLRYLWIGGSAEFDATAVCMALKGLSCLQFVSIAHWNEIQIFESITPSIEEVEIRYVKFPPSKLYQCLSRFIKLRGIYLPYTEGHQIDREKVKNCKTLQFLQFTAPSKTDTPLAKLDVGCKILIED